MKPRGIGDRRGPGSRRGIGVLAGVMLLAALLLPLAASALSAVLAPRAWLRRARWREEQAVRPMLSDLACGTRFERVTTPRGRELRVLSRPLGASRCLAIALGSPREGALIAELSADPAQRTKRLSALWDAGADEAATRRAREPRPSAEALEQSGLPHPVALIVAQELGT